MDKWNQSVGLVFYCLTKNLFAFFHISSGKTSHAKKTGGTTKTTPTPTAAARSRVSKDGGSPAQSSGTDAKTSQKSDSPTSSSVPQKASSETPSQSGELKPSADPSDNKPLSCEASSNETEVTQAASQHDLEPKSAPNGSTAGEETLRELVPGTKVQLSHINMATEETSFTEGETESSSQGEKQESTKREGGEDAPVVT